MSSIDTRVVQIQFDNTEFERNVQQTINSLERLNRLLDGKSPGGIDTLSSTINNTDFSNISSGVEAIKDRFSTLGIIGMTVLQRLTNAGIDMAAKIGGSIKKVGDQIAQGGFVRAQNLEQAKFLLEGLGADVEAVMKDVDDALTGTAYGLDEGAKTAAVFFTSGVKQGKEMYTALRAVAGAAAMTGSSYQGIADVFQDAAAKGSIMTMEITRLQQQGVKADKYLLDFINDVVDGGDKVADVSDNVKKEVMDLTNGTKLSLQDLTEDRKGLLSKGAISFEVFAAAMDMAFGEHAQEANKTFSGSLANMQTALKRLGEAFASPAMKAAIPLFNRLQSTIKEFANFLIKDYNVAELFGTEMSYLSNSIIDFLDEVTEVGILKDFAIIVGDSIHIISNAVRTMADSFVNIFPEASLQKVADFVSKIRESMSAFAHDSSSLDKFKESFERILEVIKQVGGPLISVFKTIGTIIKSQFGNAVEIVLNLSEVFGKALSLALTAINGILTRLSGPIDYVMTAFVKLSDGINKGFSRSGAAKAIELFGKAVDEASRIIGIAFDKILEYLSLFTEGSKNAISNIQSVADALGIVGVVFSGGFIAKIIQTIKDFFDMTGDSKSFSDMFKDMMESITSIPDKVGATLDSLTESLETMQKQVSGKIIKDIALAVLALAIALKILSTIDVPGLVRGLSALTILLGEMMGALTIIMKMVDSDKFAGSLKNISKAQVLTSQLIKLGLALVLMAVALKILSTVDPEGLAIGLAGLAGILGAVLGFVVALDKFGGKKMAGKFQGVTEGLMGLALALLVLSAAVKVLSSMNIVELGKGLGSVIVLLGAIMGFIIGITKLAPGGAKGMITTGIGMIAIATALNILAPALQKMGSLDMPTIGKGLLAISGALIAMAGASMFTSAVGAAGILAMTVALGALALIIERVGKLDIKVIALGLGTLIGALIALAGVSVLLSEAIIPMLGLAAAMLVMSTAIAVLGAGLIMIGAGLAAISAGIMSFAGVTQTAVLMFSNAIQTMILALIQMFPQIAVSLAESFVAFLEQIAELAPRFTDAATTIVSSLIEALENNVPRLVDTGLKLITEFLEGVSEAIPQITTACVEIIAGFINGIAEGLPDIIDAGMNLMISFIEGLAQGIRDHKEDLKTAINDLCTAILEAFMTFFGISSPSTVMEEQGVFLMEGLINGLKSVGGIGSAIIAGVKTGLGKVKSFIGNFRQQGSNLIAAIGAGIKGKAHDVKTKIGNAIKQAKEKVAGYVSNFRTAGGDLVSGIASGIRNGVSHVLSAASSIAQKALNKFKSKLGISSPSKVFAAEARWIPEGIAVGIKSGAKRVESAVSAVSDSAIEPLGEAISKAYSILDQSGDISPTITPVLDLSQIKKEAGGIGAIFGNETISIASSIGQNDIQNIQNNNLMNQLLTKMDKFINNGDTARGSNITNTFNINGADNPEEFVNTFIKTLDREMQMRAV